MEQTETPVGILPNPAAILAWRDRLSAIGDQLALVTYQHDSTVAQVRGAARTCEAISAAVAALFNVVGTASAYAEDLGARQALETWIASPVEEAADDER